MIEFMVVAAPRSRTTWLANWLTTGDQVCLHDPLLEYSLEELDNLYPTKVLGISDTSVGVFKEELNNHPARKLVVHRDKEDCAASAGMPIPDLDLWSIHGMHVHYTQINKFAEDIWFYLTGTEFDPIRFSVLKDMHVQPDFDGKGIPSQDKIQRYIKAVLDAA